MPKDASLNDLRDMMEILIAGYNKLQNGQVELEAGQKKLEAGQNKLELGQNKLIVDVVELKEIAKRHDDDIEEIKKDVKEIKIVLDKDARVQKNHQAEHVANIAAHDRFEARIVSLEKASTS